jgi:hypothetical protein
MSLMGLDVGTTGCKAVIFDLSGRILASRYKPYSMRFPGPGQCELDTDKVCRAVLEVVSLSAREAEAHDPVEAVGISTLGDSVTPVDEAGKPLSGTVLGAADRRASAEAGWLEQRVGRGCPVLGHRCPAARILCHPENNVVPRSQTRHFQEGSEVLWSSGNSTPASRTGSRYGFFPRRQDDAPRYSFAHTGNWCVR